MYDFPSSPDVSKTIVLGDQEKLAPETLSKILSAPVFPPTDSFNNQNNASRSEGITISSIRTGGDVLHVFSHIRKTYRVQWVVLRGGDSPPAIRERTPSQKGRRKLELKAEKRSDDAVNVTSQSGNHNGAIWVPLNEVMETK